MPDAISDVLTQAVSENFTEQIKNGFEIRKSSISGSPTQAVLELVGTRVCLRFSVDVRDGNVDLYVSKVRNGRPAARGSGEYFNRLTGYLRERGLKWQTSKARAGEQASLESKIRADIEIFADIIQNSAPALASDSESF